jgi:hypothetical protein
MSEEWGFGLGDAPMAWIRAGRDVYERKFRLLCCKRSSKDLGAMLNIDPEEVLAWCGDGTPDTLPIGIEALILHAYTGLGVPEL